MLRIIFYLPVFIFLLFCGCYSPRVADAYNFNVTRAELTAAGVLEIEGCYLEKSWGISELRGKVFGDTVLLSGKIEHGKSSLIRYSIARIPKYVNKVKIGSKVIWDRHRKNPPPSAAKTVENKITVLKIGQRGMNFSQIGFSEFTEIFWGAAKESKKSEVPALFFDSFDLKTVNGLSDTETLEIAGTETLRKVDLSGLNLHRLKRLVLYNVEVTGLEKAFLPELQEFRIDDFRSVPLGKVALPESLPALRSVSIQSFAGNFDFNSLKGKAIVKLQIHGDCSRFSFLKGMPLEELKLSGFRFIEGEFDILKTLPLKKLKLASRRVTDWDFLKGMKLELLDIEVAGANNFSPALLEGMPLEILRIYTNSKDFGDEWRHCAKLPLKELILRGGSVPEKFLKNSRIEKLALVNNLWHTANVQEIFISMPELKHLAVWNGILLLNSGDRKRLDDFVKWDRLSGNKLESLRIFARNLNFMKKLPAVTRLALHNKILLSLESLANREFECLLFNYDKKELMRHRIVNRSPEKELPRFEY